MFRIYAEKKVKFPRSRVAFRKEIELMGQIGYPGELSAATIENIFSGQVALKIKGKLPAPP
jgi:hypothetical protein